MTKISINTIYIAIISIEFAINVNSNLDTVNDHLDDINGNLSPVNENLDAMKIEQLAIILGILPFFAKNINQLYIFIKCLL